MAFTDKILRFLIFTLLFLFVLVPLKQNRIIVVSTTYHNQKSAIKKNIQQLFRQSHTHYILDYTFDNAGDQTVELVKKYIKKYRTNQFVRLRYNRKRIGSLANHYYAIHDYSDNDIVVIYDGDDWFKDPDVLRYVNLMYQNSNIWLTYGQFEEYPSKKKGFCRPIPDYFIKEKLLRHYKYQASHLRTFKAWLFKRIQRADLTFSKDDLDYIHKKSPDLNFDEWSVDEGLFFPMTGDLAMMLPMLEMSQKNHFKFIDKVLLIYNAENPLNDHKTNRDLQRCIDLVIRTKMPYQAI